MLFLVLAFILAFARVDHIVIVSHPRKRNRIRFIFIPALNTGGVVFLFAPNHGVSNEGLWNNLFKGMLRKGLRLSFGNPGEPANLPILAGVDRTQPTFNLLSGAQKILPLYFQFNMRTPRTSVPASMLNAL